MACWLGCDPANGGRQRGLGEAPLERAPTLATRAAGCPPKAELGRALCLRICPWPWLPKHSDDGHADSCADECDCEGGAIEGVGAIMLLPLGAKASACSEALQESSCDESAWLAPFPLLNASNAK
mmetsp:Transcript_55076/g.120476  ORF Transcript_55076/g.120476 Transcript_55076/m.120476 type:complete len:125 (+) Transcript_55076:550-924(+)